MHKCAHANPNGPMCVENVIKFVRKCISRKLRIYIYSAIKCEMRKLAYRPSRGAYKVQGALRTNKCKCILANLYAHILHTRCTTRRVRVFL